MVKSKVKTGVKGAGKKDKSVLSSRIKNLDVMLKEFELPSENLTVSAIIHKIGETLELYLKIIEQILQPEEFHSLYEANAFDDLQRSSLLELYTKIIIVHREILKAELISQEDNSIAVVQSAYSSIQSFKPSIIAIVDKMQDSWKKAPAGVTRDSMRYLG